MNKSARWREGSLWVGFALLIVAAIVTVVLPELGDKPQDDHASNAADAGPR